MPKLNEKTLKRLQSIKRRTLDMQRSSGQEIKEGKFQAVSMKVFDELGFTINVIERLLDGENEIDVPYVGPQTRMEPVQQEAEFEEEQTLDEETEEQEV